jgi:hypothetical protein
MAIDGYRGTGVRRQRRAKTAKAIRMSSKGLVKADPCLIAGMAGMGYDHV